MKILLFGDGTYAVPNYARFAGDEAGAIAHAEKALAGRRYTVEEERKIPPDPLPPTLDERAAKEADNLVAKSYAQAFAEQLASKGVSVDLPATKVRAVELIREGLE